jgi:competence protein ComEC
MRFECAMTAIITTLFITCTNPANDDGQKRFIFATANVGQGLAQFGVIDGRAVVWDMGPPNQYDLWRNAYNTLNRPRIESIIITHSDNDHYGGLEHLDASIEWNGTVIISPFEDTAKIRAASAGNFRERIKFQLCAAGDTLKILNGVNIICLWPPADIILELPLDSRERNRYSLVFSIRHGHSRAIVTGDIDSVAMEMIAVRSGYDLRAQILSAPHHGSAGSVNPLFFSYVSPQTAVVSCASQNSYGHPSREMIDVLTYMGTYLMYTYLDGTVTFTSNGYYW